MRKFYSILLTVLLGMVSYTANAINVTLNLDDPSRVNVRVNYVLQENLVAGDNSFEMNEYQSIDIQAKDDAFISEVVRTQEGSADVNEYVSNMSSCNLYVTSSLEGVKWTVKTVDANESRDGACRIWVDDATKVRVQRSGTYTEVALQEGWNDVRYITEKELPLTIGPNGYGFDLYQVKVNGEVAEPMGSSWRLSPANGDEIEIFANFPDIDVPVKFTYVDEEAKGFITGVMVNNEAVENYNEEGFTVKAGSQLTISGNTQDYKLNALTVNGSVVSFYGSYQMAITAETEINVDARKYGNVTATLNVDYPENIIVYRGYSYNNDVISLVAGENKIELLETNAMISIKPMAGCFITSVTDNNGTQYSADYNGGYNLTVTEGLEVTIISGAIERNLTALFYIDNPAVASQYFTFQRSDRYSYDGIVSGYNEIHFYEGDNPYQLSWYDTEFANVYKNGESVAPLYSDSKVYMFTLEDGDVVKAFLTCDPETYKVAFEVGEGVDADKVAVICDRIRAVKDWTEGLSVLQQTEVSVKLAEGCDYVVAVNGEEAELSEEGTVVLTIGADTKVSVQTKAGNGIREIESVTDRNTDVYSLQGVRVARSADMQSLPAGVYIVNGQKVIKR
ncbi:MAG: hypothetical protein NC388_06135 [Clostridium sp.]|nr:hypothetical protein [Clostridium sp.]